MQIDIMKTHRVKPPKVWEKEWRAGLPSGELRAEMCFRLLLDIVFLNFVPLLRQ